MGAYSSRLNKEKLEELLQKTKFTKVEITRLHHGFLEDCPTGRLTKFEFAKIYNLFFPIGNPTAFACFVFNAFDTDNTGFMGFDEFMMALSVTSRGNIDDKLEWAFGLYDIDGNGAITRDEMLEVICSIFAMTNHHSHEMVGHPSTTLHLHCMDEATSRVNKIFDMMDTDGNGELSREEFLEGARQDKSIVEAFSLYEGLM